ncbi:hypothetical protein KJ611_00120 [Patescibacteria group bacterium]|nr:hypothetical protein [Patescibacteria group bacterium]MBU1705792.1 hypothetical protein [Patescibacteria group bacterium]
MVQRRKKYDPRARFYSKIQQASQAAQNLGFETGVQYAEFYNLDKRLPSNPDKFYGQRAWKRIGGMSGFLGQAPKIKKYLTYREAHESALKLRCPSQPEYMRRFREDPRLPSRPDRTYPKQWAKNGRWLGFLGLL